MPQALACWFARVSHRLCEASHKPWYGAGRVMYSEAPGRCRLGVNRAVIALVGFT